jgi:N-glycosylase/DNA lyase
MDPVVRMFTSDSGTVRWVTTAVDTESLRFSVFGPDQWRNSSLFDDATVLVQFQAEYERFLCESGFSESLVKDRRWRERRASARATGDRRQPS